MSGRVYQMIELVQPRCSLRFGVGTCPATGTPKCYNTWATCPASARSVFNLDGEYKWRFVPIAQDAAGLEYEETDANHIIGRPLPCVRNIATSPTVINIGAIRKGESPFGIRSTITVDLAEFVWADRDGDFYLADRVSLPQAGFWQKFIRRLGDAVQQLQIRHYTWYEADGFSPEDPVDDPIVTLFDVRNMVVNKDGCRLEGDDPLQRAEASKAQFPRATGGYLTEAIVGSSATIKVAGVGTELDANYGNTGSRRYLRIGSEIILYTGYTEASGIYTLTGVVRGIAGTAEPEDGFEADEAVQRVGRYENIRMYEAAKDLLSNHSTVTAALIDTTQWDAEGTVFLPTLYTDAWVTDPTDLNKLVGELARDGLFQVWWDERAQLIKLRAVRPPQQGTVTTLTQAASIIMSAFDRKPDDRISRVTARYKPRDPFSDATENYRVVQIRLDTDAEGPFQADGTVRELVINSRWIRTESNARFVEAALLRAYVTTPEYADITLDGKDMSLEVGGFIDLSTPDFVDTEGRTLVSRWQIISWKPDWVQNRTTIRGQLSPYIGKYAVIMADGTGDYATISDEDRLIGCWLSEASGLMPDGTDAYLLW